MEKNGGLPSFEIGWQIGIYIVSNLFNKSVEVAISSVLNMQTQPLKTKRKKDGIDDESFHTTFDEKVWEIVTNNGVQTIEATPDSNLADDVKRLWAVAQKIMVSDDESPFFIKNSKYEAPNSIGMTNLGRAIFGALKADIYSIRQYFHSHQFHPLLELMIYATDKRGLFEEVRVMDRTMRAGPVLSIKPFNELVKEIRAVGSADDFKKKVRNFERNSKENLLQFNRYIDAHFTKLSRLLFIRLDLGYKESYLSTVDDKVGTIYDRIKHDWSKFHADVSRKIFKRNFRGFVWKLEYGLQKSFHLHILIILDSAKLTSDITIAKILGEHWEKNITNSRGTYFNCNAIKESYRFCGIGQVHRDDVEKRQALRERVGAYLTKPDYVVTLQTPDGGRTFGKGNMPK